MPSKQSFSVLLFSAALLGQFQAVAQDRALRIDRNIVYGMYSGLALLMDVYTPATPNGFGIVIVPATGWASPLEYGTTGMKNNAVSEFLPILQAGYIVFAINHRTTPRFRFPAPLEDVQRAVRFIRYNAKNYGIDSAHIGGAGGSSGGHLLGLLAMLREPGIDGDSDPVNRQPATLQALVLRAPATDLKAMSHFTEG